MVEREKITSIDLFGEPNSLPDLSEPRKIIDQRRKAVSRWFASEIEYLTEDFENKRARRKGYKESHALLINRNGKIFEVKAVKHTEWQDREREIYYINTHFRLEFSSPEKDSDPISLHNYIETRYPDIDNNSTSGFRHRDTIRMKSVKEARQAYWSARFLANQLEDSVESEKLSRR